MVAGGANLRGLLAHDDVTAVAALPHLDLAFGEDLRRLYIAQQGENLQSSPTKGYTTPN